MKQYGYPLDWDSIKTRIKRKFKFTCQKCFRKHLPNSKNLHVHHIVSISKGGSHEDKNLTLLCKWCHGSLHPHMYLNKSKKSFNKTRKYTLKRKK